MPAFTGGSFAWSRAPRPAVDVGSPTCGAPDPLGGWAGIYALFAGAVVLVVMIDSMFMTEVRHADRPRHSYASCSMRYRC